MPWIHLLRNFIGIWGIEYERNAKGSIIRLKNFLKWLVFLVNKDSTCIGQKIKNVRMERRMTQRQLAEKINTEQQTISKYENGIHAVSRDILVRIAQVLDVPESYFYGIDVGDIAEDEWLLIEYYRTVDDCLKNYLLEIARNISNVSKKAKKL